MSGEGAFPEDERLARLRLARTERVGPVAFDHLIKRFGSAEAAIAGLPDLVGRTGGSIRVAPLADAENELASGELVMPCPHVLHSRRNYYLVYPENRVGSTSLRLFSEWLHAEADTFREEGCPA